MKKMLSILMIAILLLSCVSITAAAAERKTKISDSLQQAMDEVSDDDKIEVDIWLYCKIDTDLAFRQAIKECGYIAGLPST